MKEHIILKVTDGELFRFFDSEDRTEFVLGSRRTCDLVVKSPLVLAEQLRFVCEEGTWWVEDLTPAGAKSEAACGGKLFRHPKIKLDGELSIRRAGDKKPENCVRISLVKQIAKRRSGAKVDLTRKTVTVVGRAADCDIVVDNPQVSERHFRIIFDGEACFVEDLHSMNGTYVNNKKVRRARLSDYDRVSIPTAAYTFYDRKLLFSTSPAGIQIDVVGVTKDVADRNSRGKVRLVDRVSFRVEAGDFVAVVGGSGAGKSTVLDCINGMRPATGGRVYYDTNDYYDNINSYKNVVGYVPQKDIMHDDLSVAEGLYYTAQIRMRTDLSREEIEARVRAAVADVSLTGKEHLRISALSGGQKKRVSIAMELLADPKVIFLDEPTSGLSPDLDLEMMQLLKDLAKKGRTIVVITHAMENLDKCDRVAFLGRGGRLCFYGKADEVFKYFNRRSYSRIFAALSDEETCLFFERKYRAGAYYRKMYKTFVQTYGESETLAPPADESEAKRLPAPPAPIREERHEEE